MPKTSRTWRHTEGERDRWRAACTCSLLLLKPLFICLIQTKSLILFPSKIHHPCKKKHNPCITCHSFLCCSCSSPSPTAPLPTPPRYPAKAFFHKVYLFGDHSSIGGGHGRPPPLPPFSIDASDLHPEFNSRRAKYIFVRFTLR